MNELLSWPERIFLAPCGAHEIPRYQRRSHEGIAWFEAPTHLQDVVYVRADIYASVQEAHAKALQGEEVMRERWQQARELNVGMERKVQKMQVQIDQQAAIIRGGFHGAK